MGPDNIYSWKNNNPDKSCTLKWWGFNISLIKPKKIFCRPGTNSVYHECIKTLDCTHLQNSAHDTNMCRRMKFTHFFKIDPQCSIQWIIYILLYIYKNWLCTCMYITICIRINMLILCTCIDVFNLLYGIHVHVMIYHTYITVGWN